MIHLLLASAAWPCAGLVHDDLSSAEADSAEVVFEPGNGDVSVTYEVTYDGDAEAFGWIIPVPDEVLQVADGDAGMLEQLHELTDPGIVRLDDDSGGSCGCAGTDDAKAGGGRDLTNDIVAAQGFTGSYAWTAVRSDDPDALTDWFTDSGWAPLPEEDILHYVALNSWFLAVTILPQRAATPEEGRDLPPLMIRYAGDAIRFPSVMARSAAVPDQRTTVWVVADTSAAVTEGWTHTDLSSLTGSASDDPVALFDDALAELGSDRGWARTFAGDTLLGHVTRFDTLAPASVHDVDAVFGLEDVATDALVLQITLGGGGGSTAVLLLPMLGLLTVRRRG